MEPLTRDELVELLAKCRDALDEVCKESWHGKWRQLINQIEAALTREGPAWHPERIRKLVSETLITVATPIEAKPKLKPKRKASRRK